MVAMSISGRMKEIGIRKVLGASGWSISWMMNKEFIFITLLGAVLALPLSWYIMQDWVSQFAVRQWPSWVNFLLILVAGLSLVMFIVTGQSIRAAQMNPVDTLKNE
jgi:putative ABC transport system permease protein